MPPGLGLGLQIGSQPLGAEDFDLCAGLLLHHAHEFAVEIAPFHRHAIPDALPGADCQLIDGAGSRQPVLLAIPLIGAQLVFRPSGIFAALQLGNVLNGVSLDPFQIDGVAAQDRQNRDALIRL